MEEYNEFSNMIQECSGGDDVEDNGDKSKWILRFIMDKEAMLDKNINMDDVHFAIEHSYKGEISCIYSDFNADKLVLERDWISHLLIVKRNLWINPMKFTSLKIYSIILMNNVILSGIKKIPKVLLRKSVNQLKFSEGNYEKEDTWVLDTVGSNLPDILTLQDIDTNRAYSNNIQEVYRTLGIESCKSVYIERSSGGF